MRWLLLMLVLFASPAYAGRCDGVKPRSQCEAIGCRWYISMCVTTDEEGRRDAQSFLGKVQQFIVNGIIFVGLIGLAVITFFIWALVPKPAKVDALQNPQQHLTAAYHYINPVLEKGSVGRVEAQLLVEQDLAKAARHLMHARASDVSATITIAEKNKTYTYTVDDLSFMALYAEAILYHACAEMGNPHAFVNKDYDQSFGNKALRAINKALQYRPHGPLSNTFKGEILLALGRRHEARQAAEYALTKEPDNIRALRLRDATT